MTSKAQHRAQGIQEFVDGQLDEARKQIARFERSVAVRGQQQRRGLEKLIARVTSRKDLKAIRSQAQGLRRRVLQWLDGFPGRLVRAAGVASAAQLDQLNRELTRLARKVDALAARKSEVS